MAETLTIVQVTPFAWEVAGDVNGYVERVSDELAAHGHRVLILAPTQSTSLARETRRALRERPDSLLERAEDGPVVLGAGEVLPFSPTRRRAASLPVDVARTIEDALSELEVDIVHVHEPFAPSASSSALRHSRALNVATFHAPTERLLSTQLTRPLARLLFGRLDARIASYRATRDLIQSYFPGEYEVIVPGADVEPRAAEQEEMSLLLSGSEDRGGLRVALRALRALPAELDWRATILSAGRLASPVTLSARLRDRIEVLDAETLTEPQALAQSEILVLASEGIHPSPGTLVRALGAGVVPVTSRLPVYEELLEEGDYGLQFEPGDAQTLASHLTHLISEPEARKAVRERMRTLEGKLTWARVAVSTCFLLPARWVPREKPSAST